MEELTGKTILHLCGNAGVTFIIWKGSNRAALAEMFRKLDFELIMNWVSREAELRFYLPEVMV